MELEVIELASKDIHNVVEYFTSSSEEYLKGMGAIKSKLPKRENWIKAINDDLKLPTPERKFYYLGWKVDDKLIGHTNINNINYGKEAFMHLHMWDPINRGHGIGSALVKISLPYFFNKFDLKKLICEPFAKNKRPVNTLLKSGFTYRGTRHTTPSIICDPQTVNRFVLTRQEWQESI